MVCLCNQTKGTLKSGDPLLTSKKQAHDPPKSQSKTHKSSINYEHVSFCVPSPWITNPESGNWTFSQWMAALPSAFVNPQWSSERINAAIRQRFSPNHPRLHGA